MTFEELADALDGLFAYHSGATDSGIDDASLKLRCVAVVRADPALLQQVAHHRYGKLPYGRQDIDEFLDWAAEELI